MVTQHIAEVSFYEYWLSFPRVLYTAGRVVDVGHKSTGGEFVWTLHLLLVVMLHPSLHQGEFWL